ncbi:MAG: spore germination protein, partial [Ruminococcus sp.]|nr:spore germination protein [Ruminococcus sp.]
MKKDIKIPPSLSSAADMIKNTTGDTCELNSSFLYIGAVRIGIFSAEGMAGSLMINEALCEAVTNAQSLNFKNGSELFDMMFGSLLTAPDKKAITSLDEIILLIFSGFTVIIIDGCERAIAFGTQGFQTRSVSLPVNDQTIHGSQEAFSESIRICVSQIRRRLKTPKLRFEMLNIGKLSRTDVCIAYIDGRANGKAIADIRKRLTGIKLDTMLSGEYLLPFIEKGYGSTLFSPTRLTERPDTACAALNEGRIVILTDGSPFCIIIPTLFAESFTTPDDLASKPLYVTFIRWLKFISFFLAAIFPGLYAAAVFTPEVFAFKLLLNLYSAEESSQLPLGLEVLIITLLLEILKEAGIRLPKAVGSAVSIVGGLIIGDAAVKCGLISAPLLILVGLTATASFVIPEISEQVSVIRMIF